MEHNTMGIKLHKETLSDIKKSMTLEWILTNGLGGYSSSSVLEINTRKYHGILVASLNPPINRWVVLSKLDAHLLIDGEVHSVGANEFNHGIIPQGYKYIESFERFPFPSFLYRIEDIEFKKTIIMPHQKNAVVVFYEILPKLKNVVLKIQPLVNSRHFHDTTKRINLGWGFSQEKLLHNATIGITNPKSALVLSSSSGKYIAEDKWVEGIFFRTDNSEGTSCFDDCYIPGRFEINLESNKTNKFCIIVSADKNLKIAESINAFLLNNLAKLHQIEIRRLERLLSEFYNHHPKIKKENWLKWLILASDSFIVNRLSTKTKTVIAGYHWFEDWGRDSLICLPGLTLVTGRFADAREILLTFKHYYKQGIIPNRFPDSSEDEPIYNTVDATLLFLNAVLQYLKYTGDYNFVHQKLWTLIKSVIDYHIQGTINNIQLDDDGLIMHGPQLTWMDATLDNNPVTPRDGKAVEIQALWYNALRTMEVLAKKFRSNDLAEKYFAMAENTKQSFIRKFWNPEANYLFDVVKENYQDSSLRPNQILAVSLDFSMLDKKKQTSIVSVIQKELWAKYGLRTLSVNDSRYIGRYAGNWTQRNSAYHNGTAWAWLTGPFVSAFLKVNDFNIKYRELAFNNFLLPLFNKQTQSSGLGTLSEVFDGDADHLSGGCISQAWSVAEPLRAYVEDVLLERPKFEKDIL